MEQDDNTAPAASATGFTPDFGVDNEKLKLALDTDEYSEPGRIGWAANYLGKYVTFGAVDSFSGAEFDKDRNPMEPAAYLKKMQTAVKDPSTLYTKDFIEFSKLKTLDEQVAFAEARPAQKTLGEKAADLIKDAPPPDWTLTDDELAFLPENSRAEYQAAKDKIFWDTFNSDMPDEYKQSNLPYQNGMDKEMVARMREESRKNRVVEEYRQRLTNENFWAQIIAVRPALSQEANSVLDIAAAHKDDTEAWTREEFLKLPRKDQVMVAPLLHEMQFGAGDNSLLGDAARAAGRTFANVTAGTGEAIAHAIERLGIDAPEYQERRETESLLRRAFDPKMKQRGYLGQSVVGFFGTLPYMAVAAVPYAGPAAVALSAAEDFEKQIVDEGGDVSGMDVYLGKFAVGWAYAAIEKAQVIHPLKGITDMGKRQAYLHMFDSLHSFLKVGGIQALSLGGEVWEEGLQGALEKGFVAYGADKDIAAEMARGMVSEMVDSVGSFAPLMAIEAGGSRRFYQRGGYTAEELGRARMAARNLYGKVKNGDMADVADFGDMYGHLYRVWLAGGENPDFRIGLLQRRFGLDPKTAGNIEQSLRGIWRSFNGNEKLQREALGGVSPMDEFGVLQAVFPDSEVYADENGRKHFKAKLSGGTIYDLALTRENLDNRIDLDDESQMASVIERVVAVGVASDADKTQPMTPDEFRALPRERQEQIVSQLKLKKLGVTGDWNVKIGDKAELSGDNLRTLSGKIILDVNAMPNTVLHETVHGFAKFLEAAVQEGDGDALKLLESLQAAYPPVKSDERINEERLADAWRDRITARMIEVNPMLQYKTDIDKAINWVKKLLGLATEKKASIDAGIREIKNSQDALFDSIVKGDFSKIPGMDGNKAATPGAEETKTGTGTTAAETANAPQAPVRTPPPTAPATAETTATTAATEEQPAAEAAQAQAAIPPPATSGTVTWKASTPYNEMTVGGHYEVRDASEIVTSLDEGYDQRRQNMDRESADSRAKRAAMKANFNPSLVLDSEKTDGGAPIVSKKLEVQSGNNRTVTIREMYAEGLAEPYRKAVLEFAAKNGIAVDENIKNPVLVRVLDDDMTQGELEYFIRATNATSDTSELTDADNDRFIIQQNNLMPLFDAGETGEEYLSANNAEFLRAFTSRAIRSSGMRDREGKATDLAVKRIRNAMLAELASPTAAPNFALLDNLFNHARDGSGNGVNIGKQLDGIMTAAPDILRLDGEYSIRQFMPGVLNELFQAAKDGVTVANAVAQSDMFGDIPPIVADTAMMIDEFKNAPQRIADCFREYARLAGLQQGTDNALFDMEHMTPSRLMQAAKRKASAGLKGARNAMSSGVASANAAEQMRGIPAKEQPVVWLKIGRTPQERSLAYIPTKKVNAEYFNMGIPTENLDESIRIAYEKAAEVQTEFKRHVEAIGASLGCMPCRFEEYTNEKGEIKTRPVINGKGVLTRSVLKGEERVRQKIKADEKTPGTRGVNDIVDIFGSTIIITPDMTFGQAIDAIEAEGYFKVARVKNCYTGENYINSGYGDVKVNVLCPNGFVGEIIIADAEMAESKMNGVGHAIYEIARQTDNLLDRQLAEKLEQELNAFSRLVYNMPGEDQSVQSAIHAAVSSSLQPLAQDAGTMWGGLTSSEFLAKLPSLINSIAHWSPTRSYNRLSSGSTYRSAISEKSPLTEDIVNGQSGNVKKNYRDSIVADEAVSEDNLRKFAEGKGIASERVADISRRFSIASDYASRTMDFFEQLFAETTPETTNKDKAKEAFGRAFEENTSEAWKAAFATEEAQSGDLPTVTKYLSEYYTRPDAQTIPIRGMKVRDSKDVAGLLMSIRSPYQQLVKVIAVGEGGEIMDAQIVTVGPTGPSARVSDILAPVLRCGAKKFYVASNHPSGNPTPLNNDRQLAKLINYAAKNLGVGMIDHIITDGGKFCSLSDKIIRDVEDGGLQPWETTREQPAVWGAEQAAQIASIVRQQGQSSSIISLDENNNLIGVSLIPDAKLLNDGIVRDVMRSLMSTQATSFILALNGEMNTFAIEEAAKLLGVRMLDVVTIADDGTFTSKRAGGARSPIPGAAESKNRFSIVSEGAAALDSAERDAQYLAAVERGDMETAQRMVREAAAKAMPNTKVVGDDGLPMVVYHGTNKKFYEFLPGKIGSGASRKNSNRENFYGPGFYFAEDYNSARDYGRNVISAFVDIRNPAFSDFNKKPENDGIRAVAGFTGRIWVADKSSQIKSADPVTYDDAGNVIPLSERFNPQNNDIRYSIVSEAEVAEARRQYDEVVARYTNPDSTKKPGWLMAPNGKPTKLTERQWVQVRTENFKRWFGDWEAQAEIDHAVEFALNGEPVSVISGAEFQQNGKHDLIDRVASFFESIGGIVANNELGEVVIDRYSVKSSLGYGVGREKAAAFAAVPDVIRKGVVFNRQGNWKNRGIESFVLVAPIRIGNENYVCEAIVERKYEKTEKRFYLHEVNLQSAISDTIKTPTGGASIGNLSRPVRSILANNAKKFNRKSVSMVIDENGEPMVVWHGSKSKHTVYDQVHTFHVSNRDIASGYGDVVDGNFVNARNVLEIDADGGEWLSVNTPDALTHLFKDGDEIEDGRGFTATFDSYSMSVRDIATFAKKVGYDGVIVRNVEDTNESTGELGTDIVTFGPSQIKSATDNIGTFDAANPDIRYSISGGVGGEIPQSVADLGESPRNSMVAEYYRPGQYSNDTYLTAMICQDKIRGISRPDTEYEKLRESIGAKISVEDAAKRAAESVRTNRRVLEESLKGGAGDAVASTASAIEQADLDKTINRLFTKTASFGVDVGGKAVAAYGKMLRRIIADTPALTLAEMRSDTGADLLHTLMEILPEVFRAEDEAAADKDGENTDTGADAEGKAKQSGEFVGPPSPADVAQWQKNAEERQRKCRAAVLIAKRWVAEHQAEVKARQEAAKKAAEEKAAAAAAAGETAPGADTDTDAEPESDTPDETVGMLAIPREIFEEANLMLGNAEEFAAFMRAWVADYLIRTNHEANKFATELAEKRNRNRARGASMTGPVDVVFENGQFLGLFRKTMIEQLRDIARGLLDPTAGRAAFNAERMIADISDYATADQIESRAADILAFIQRNAIRQSRKSLIGEIVDLIDEQAVKGRKLDALEKDMKRKIRGEHEAYCRYIRKIVRMSDNAVAKEAAELQAILDGRQAEYDEAKKDFGVDIPLQSDVEYHRAMEKLAALQVWGGLKNKLPSEIAVARKQLAEWLETERAAHERKWGMFQEECDRLAEIVQECVSKNQRKYTKDEPGFFGKIDEDLISSVRQRLERMMAGAGAERTEAIRAVLTYLSEGSEKLGMLKAQYREQFDAALEWAVEASDMTVQQLLDKLDEQIPEELNEQLITEEQKTRMTWGQAIQLYASLLQTATYGENIHIHGRETHAELIREAAPPELLRLVSKFQEIYQLRREELSETVQQVTGLPIWNPDPLYMPVKMRTGPREGLDAASRAWSPLAKSLTPRVKNGLDFDLSADIMNVFNQRSQESARAIAFGVRGIALRSILARKATLEKMVQNHGTQRTKRLIEQVTDTLTDGFNGDTPQGGLLNVLQKAGTFTTYAALSWNIVTALKQMTSVTAWVPMLDGGYMELGKYICDFDRESAKELCDAPGFTARYGATSFGKMFRDALNNPAGGNVLTRLVKAGMTAIQIGDFVPGILVGTGFYKARLAELVRHNPGADVTALKQKAITETWAFIEENQQSSRLEAQSAALRRWGVMGRAVAKFATSPLQQVAHELHTLHMWREAKALGNTEQAALYRRRFINTLISNHIVMPVLMYAVTGLFGLALGGEPPEDDELWGDILLACMVGSWGRVFFVGSIVNNVLGQSLKAAGLKPAMHEDAGFAASQTIEKLVGKGFLTAGDIANADWESVGNDFIDTIAVINAPARYAVKASRNYAGYDPKKHRRDFKKLMKNAEKEAAGMAE